MNYSCKEEESGFGQGKTMLEKKIKHFAFSFYFTPRYFNG